MAKANEAISTGVSALIVIVIVLIVGFGVYLDATINTASTSSVSNGSSKTATINSTFSANNTETESPVSNYTATTATVVTSETPPCTPSSAYISTSTLSEQSSITTVQVAYDGTTCNFGNSLFEPPSAILIPANTLVWTNFQLQVNNSYFVNAAIHFLPFPAVVGANITVAVYLNDILNSSSTTPVTQLPNAVTNSSLIPTSNSSNSIFALTGVTPTGGVGMQTGSAVNLNGTTITIAILSDKPLWLSGWTPEDMSKGTGAQFGQSTGQLSGTYEWPDSGLSLPNSLPQPTTKLTFELQISGDYFS